MHLTFMYVSILHNENMLMRGLQFLPKKRTSILLGQTVTETLVTIKVLGSFIKTITALPLGVKKTSQRRGHLSCFLTSGKTWGKIFELEVFKNKKK